MIEQVACNEESGTYAVVDERLRVQLYDLSSGEVKVDFFLEDVEGVITDNNELSVFVNGMWFVRPNALLIHMTGIAKAFCIDPYEKRITWSVEDEIEGLYNSQCDISKDGNTLCVVGNRAKTTINMEHENAECALIIDTKTGALKKEIELNRNWDNASVDTMAVDQNGKRVCMIKKADLYVIDVEKGQIATAKLPYSSVYYSQPYWVDDGLITISEDGAGSATKTCTVQKYSNTGNEEWKVDTQSNSVILGNSMYYGISNVWDRLDSMESFGDRVLASFGTRLVTIDLKDGRISEVFNFNSPVVACKVSDTNSGQRIYVCVASGEVTVFSSNADGVDAVRAWFASIGKVSAVEFLDVSGLHLLATRAENEEMGDVKTVVYTFSSVSECADPEGETWSLPHPATAEQIREQTTVLAESLQVVPFSEKKYSLYCLTPAAVKL